MDILKILLKIFIGIIILITFLGLIVFISDNGKILLPIKDKPKFVMKKSSKPPSDIKVEGNNIVNQNGVKIRFKGLMPADPARLHNLNKFNKKIFSEMKSRGANIVRIPVHPENWVDDVDYLYRYLDPIIQWTAELDMYVIIDWHYIGNISTGEGEHMPDIKTHPEKLTEEFWKKTSRYFKDTPHVMFEIYNEPADITSKVWINKANRIVDVIRNQGAEQIIIVGGTEYGKNISWVKNISIRDQNIVYASHIYPIHKNELWDYYFGNIAEYYPVLITEWGFKKTDTKKKYLIGNKENFGGNFIDYLDSKNIGWIACWYDNSWEPEMFSDDFEQLNDYGKFIINNLN